MYTKIAPSPPAEPIPAGGGVPLRYVPPPPHPPFPPAGKVALFSDAPPPPPSLLIETAVAPDPPTNVVSEPLAAVTAGVVAPTPPDPTVMTHVSPLANDNVPVVYCFE